MYNLKKGSLLISEPSLTENTFFKSVILVLHHCTEESIGIILNQPTKVKLNEIFNELPVKNLPVYIGGPVEKNSIQFIHTLGELIPNNKKISEGLYWGGDFETIVQLMSENKISRNQIRFFAGYAGWHENQLESEVRENNWIIHNHEPKICMKYSNEKLWSTLIKTKQKKYAIWANMPKDPSLN